METITKAGKSPKKRVRKVCNMSQEQLQAKRDQDREAQRAFRERSRLRIQALEQELAAVKANQHTEPAISEPLASLQEENRELKAQLRRIHEISVPPGDMLSREHDNALEPSQASIRSNVRTATNRMDFRPSISRQPPSEEPMSLDDISGDQQRPGYALSLPTDPRILGDDGHKNKLPPWASHVSLSDHDVNSQIGLQDDNRSAFDERSDSRSLNYCTSSRSPELPTHPAENPVSWANPEVIDQVPKHAIFPKHFAATCPLDQILLNFLSAQRTRVAQGTPTESLLEPRMPAISGLIDPTLKTTLHSVSRVMVDIVSTFKDTNLKEQLGFLYIMYSTMRWLVSPSYETFDDLPPWLHPTVMQVIVPHPAWIDNVPWPQVRDLLIQDPVKYSFANFSEVYARFVSLEWPFDITDAVMRPEHYNGEYLMNPLFEKNIRKLECWSVREPFRERFPELAALMVA